MRPIGVIRTDFREMKETPIQSAAAKDARGTVEVFAEFADGLSDVEGFSHLILLYVFDRTQGFELRTTPYMDDHPRGVFATRAPRRPNPIGMTVVRLLGRRRNLLDIAELDIIDRTPLLDIKPYVPDFDLRTEATSGWIAHAPGRSDPRRWKDDGRFGE